MRADHGGQIARHTEYSFFLNALNCLMLRIPSTLPCRASSLKLKRAPSDQDGEMPTSPLGDGMSDRMRSSSSGFTAPSSGEVSNMREKCCSKDIVIHM